MWLSMAWKNAGYMHNAGDGPFVHGTHAGLDLAYKERNNDGFARGRLRDKKVMLVSMMLGVVI